jgi:hypothetical protein
MHGKTPIGRKQALAMPAILLRFATIKKEGRRSTHHLVERRPGIIFGQDLGFVDYRIPS